MSAKHEEQDAETPSEREIGLLEAVVRDYVLLQLGRPRGLHHVQVRKVFGRNFRVNVFIGDEGFNPLDCVAGILDEFLRRAMLVIQFIEDSCDGASPAFGIV